MKRNDWILITSTICYTILFYNQTAGVNFFVFNLLLIFFLYVKDKKLLKERNWLLAAIGALLSSACIAIHGNALAVTANIISLGLLSAISFNSQTSVVVSLIQSIYAWCSSPFLFLINKMEKNEFPEEGQPVQEKSNVKWLLILVPVAITLVFFFIYRSSSTLFDALADKINLDFISWSWIFFTLGGFVLLYGFFSGERIAALDELEAATGNTIDSKNVKPIVFFGRELKITDENFSATLLFVMLNALLLIVNALDVSFIFGGSRLPLGVTYKQFVHQGTDMLITSIIIAIALILYYFRSGLNFYEKNKTVKMLAYAWIAQNAFMLFSTAWRNYCYIDEYGLTYKRIGVYVYLLLTLIGLATTFIKVQKAKSNMYLFRKNSWIFYGLLIILSFPDWARIVSGYNVLHIKDLDGNYLLSISDNTLPDLLPYYNKSDKGLLKDSADKKQNFNYDYCTALYRTLNAHDYADVRSWCYDDQRLYNEISSAEFVAQLKSLNFNSMYLDQRDFDLLGIYKHVEELHLHGTSIGSLGELAGFPQLKVLDLAANSNYNRTWLSLVGIEKLAALQELDITNDVITDWAPIYSMTHLKHLHVSFLDADRIKELQQKLPNTQIDQVSTYYK